MYQDPLTSLLLAGVMQALGRDGRGAYGSTDSAFDTQYIDTLGQ